MPEPTAPSHALTLDEAAARRLLLVQAIERADTHGRIVGAAECEQLEQAALDATRDPARPHGPPAAAYLAERARRFLQIAEGRQPRLVALQHGSPWRHVLGWGLPALALATGALLERIDDPQQVNMLSPPLLGFLLWNLLVYLGLLLTPLLPRWREGAGPLAAVRRWIALAPALEGPRRRLSGRLQADVRLQLRLRWWEVAGRLEGWRAARTLHAAAAAWAVGVALSITLGGLVREYRVGWESTLLDLPQVHAFLKGLFAPVVALLPMEGFSQADLARMHFRSGVAVTREESRHWIALYLALLALVVVLPRTLLAVHALLRRRWLARAVVLDLREPYFEEVLARVSPARVVLGLVVLDDGVGTAVQRVLRQATDHPGSPPPPAPAPWEVLATPRGDTLQVLTLQAPTAMPLMPTDAAQAGGPPGGWRERVQGWWTRAAPAGGAQDEAADAQALQACDLVLVAVLHPAQLAVWPGTARPALLLAGDAAQASALAQAAGRPGAPAEVLALDQVAAGWWQEAALREAIARRLPRHKAPGMARLTQLWRERHEARLDAAMRLVAGLLLQAARQQQEVASGGPLTLRHLVDPSEREAGQRSREAAAQEMLARIGQARAHAWQELARLHGFDDAAQAAPAAHDLVADSGSLHVRQGLDAPQAGMAGVASGAAAGATIDLMTGGLTLGAATALGAAIGGGAALAAAVWKNRGAPGGAPVVQASDTLLLALAQEGVARYAAVAMRERPALPQGPLAPQLLAQALQSAGLDEPARWAAARQPDTDEGPWLHDCTQRLRQATLGVLGTGEGPGA